MVWQPHLVVEAKKDDIDYQLYFEEGHAVMDRFDVTLRMSAPRVMSMKRLNPCHVRAAVDQMVTTKVVFSVLLCEEFWWPFKVLQGARVGPFSKVSLFLLLTFFLVRYLFSFPQRDGVARRQLHSLSRWSRCGLLLLTQIRPWLGSCSVTDGCRCSHWKTDCRWRSFSPAVPGQLFFSAKS